MKNNKFFVFLISFVFALTLPFVLNFFKSSAVAEAKFISIDSYEDLKAKFSVPNALEQNYKLNNDIVFPSQADFLPLGLSLVDEEEIISNFTGIFDGNGKSIIGLNFDSSETFYRFGLFAHLENATVKNLILQDILIDNENVFNTSTLNNKTILIGGVSAVSEASVIENTQINFKNFKNNEEPPKVTFQKLTLSGKRVDFGGVVARAYYGTTIKNVKVSTNFEFSAETEKIQTINAGLVAGDVYNSYLHNVLATGSFKFEKHASVENQITVLNLGSLAGSVERANTLIKATYSNITFEIVNLEPEKVSMGALVGKIVEFDSPTQQNLSHNILITKTLNQGTLTDFNQTFGNAGNYNQEDSVYTYLTRDNYTIFETPVYWTGLLSSYKWNTKTIWKLSASSLPSLQMFDSYTVELSLDKTRISLSSSTLPQDLLVMHFEDEYEQETKNISKSFDYNEKVTVLIALINNFDIYYKLQSVEINGSTVINKLGTNGNYALSQVEILKSEEPEEEMPYPDLNSTKIYLFSFNVSNFDSGEISITLEKVGFDFVVKTQNPDEGKVKRKEAQTANNSLTQTIYVGTLYEFVAEPVSNNFVLEKWVMELEDETTFETYYVELDKFDKRSNISFEFGTSDSSGITENFLNGGQLVAIFSSNITKITFMIEEDTQENKNAGQIFDGDEIQEFFSSTEVSFLKNTDLVFVAKEKDGYTFKGWYDNQNRLRERNQILNYRTSEDEDAITLIAVYEKNAGLNSLTTLWIVLGSVAGAGLIIATIIIIKRKSSDMSYKNFY